MLEKNPIATKTRFQYLHSKKTKIVLLAIPYIGVLIALIIYSWGYLLLGAEGNFITNFQLTKTYGSYSWVPLINGTGFPVATLNILVGIFDFFALLQNLGYSYKTVNTAGVLLIYILPYLSMFWLLKRVLKVNFYTSYLMALFYTFNPLFIFMAQSMMFWNMAPFFVLPLIFGCIYKYYYQSTKLFLSFGTLSALLAFSFSNIPYLGVFQILLIISVILIPMMRKKGGNVKRILGNWILLQTSFVLFNAWWIINLLRFNLQDLSAYYTTEFATNWAITNATDGSGMLLKILTFTTRLYEGENYFADLFLNTPIRIILLIPIILIIISLLKEHASQEYPKRRKYFLTVTLFLSIIIFLQKGPNEPLGGIYVWMLENIPYFIIFKTPAEKFSVLVVFLTALALTHCLKNSNRIWSFILIIVFLIPNIIPFATLNFIPEPPFSKGSTEQENKYVSKKYKYKEGYFEAAESINKNKLDYRYVSLSSNNYQETILNHDGNKYYRGMNPFLHATNKPFITAYSGPTQEYYDSIYKNLSKSTKNLPFDIYSIRKIVFNQDILGPFPLNKNESPEKIYTGLSKQYERRDFDSISIFTREEYLPHIYTGSNIMITSTDGNNLKEIMKDRSYKPQSVIYFENQNEPEHNAQIQQLQKNRQALKFNDEKILKIKKELKYVNKEISALNTQMIQQTNIESKKQNEQINREISSNMKKQNGLLQEQTQLIKKLPILEYRRINPTKYRVIIHNALGEFPLVFSEAFHQGWKMYLGKTAIETGKKPNPADLSNYKILDQNESDQASKETLEDFLREGLITTLGDGKEKTIIHQKMKNNNAIFDYEEKYMIDFISKNFQGTIQNDNLPDGKRYETWFKEPMEKNTNHLKANGYANSWLLNTDSICRNESSCHKNPDGTYTIETIIEFWPERLLYVGLAITAGTFLINLAVLGFISQRKRYQQGTSLLKKP